MDLPGLEIRPACTLMAIDRLRDHVTPVFTPLKESVRSVAERSFAIGSSPHYAAAAAT
jgi:hypothetical protein